LFGFGKISRHKLQAPSLSWAQVVAYVCFWSVIFFALANSTIGEYIDQKIRIPTDFRVRSWLSKDPEISPKLKIFAVDDRTVNWLHSASLSIPQWSSLLAAIDVQKPKLILIDKIFGLDEGKSKDAGGRVSDQLTKINTPVVVGSFIPKKELKYRSPLNLDRPEFAMNNYLTKEIVTSEITGVTNAPNNIVYGPYPEMAKYVALIGHIHYASDHRITPMYRVGKDKVLPHFGLYAANSISLTGRQFKVDDKIVPVDGRNRILVDMPQPRKLYKKTYSLMHNLKRIQEGKPFDRVSSGDIVMILPMLYTGNTDFKDSPFGPIPASFTHVSLVNSVLTGNWLWVSGSNLLMIVFCSLICGSIVLLFGNTVSVILLSVCVVGYVAVSLMLFSYFSVSTSWWSAVSASCMSFVSLYVTKARANEQKSWMLKSAFNGSVSSDQLNQLVKSASKVKLEAKEQVVTIMFLDVVGYSLLAENQVPRVAFGQLKRILGELTNEIHRYGGVVNKTLGDGLLCLFGCDFNGGSTDGVGADHAEKAVACAVSIQRANVRRNLECFERGEPVYPLRIGIHTASVYLGDLGSDERIDFTAVGNGVNYAKRMEQACEVHQVLLSDATKSFVESLNLDDNGLSEVKISIKHHSVLMKAYSYNPFHEHDHIRKDALEAYRKCASLARIDQRFLVSHPDLFTVHSHVGVGKLINFSATGLSFEVASHLEKSAMIVLKVGSTDLKLNQLLSDSGIEEITGEVRWSYEDSGNFIHGVLFRNLSDVQSSSLVELIKEYDEGFKLDEIA